MARTTLAPAAVEDAFVVSALAEASELSGFGADIDTTLAWGVDVGRRAPSVGDGRTRRLWELLAATAAVDVTASRILEPHLDALSILRQSGVDLDRWDSGESLHVTPTSSWGVFAAEGAGMRLRAEKVPQGWSLTGTKPWCSLAGRLSHALVTAWVDDTRRGLFAVDLRAHGVSARPGPWTARGLTEVVSAPVDFDGARAVPIGDPGWYLERPGFAWGGMSVAACWWGAAVALADRLTDAARSERADQLALVHAGRADAALWAARAALHEAAVVVDAGESTAVGEALLAGRVRAIVADAATLTLSECDAALGPSPLVSDENHARRVADLHLYLRQHHALRDIARIGRGVAAREGR